MIFFKKYKINIKMYRLSGLKILDLVTRLDSISLDFTMKPDSIALGLTVNKNPLILGLAIQAN